ncbi:hypothetical protein OESDEN_11449 [Oesophagostomum dentatum]|uniref:ATP-dependent DNA helicase n=1 Tax=Oesophagostomum dentatum TaxID=61180 RepID=A0A0B1SUX5_OESDE|nr:hypothetical protein OESDEN_11449 [Oesophagostomum dentatum]
MHSVISLSPHLPGEEPVFFKSATAQEITPATSRLPKIAGNKLFFIYGRAGCGKTHTLNALTDALESEANVDAFPPTGLLLNSVDVIIWDEISMQYRFAIECVERTFVLNKNVRLDAGEAEYAAWLFAVGEGRNFDVDDESIELPHSMCMGTEQAVIDWLYRDEILDKLDELGKVALLTEGDGVDGLPYDNEEYFHKLAPPSLPPYVLKLKFPVRLSFYMTINKSQGQTFDKVGVILRTPSFAHGSTYVALS